jgi:hypothetical protein
MLDRLIANTIACSIISTRLDYCNSMLFGTSTKNIQKFQQIQNTLAHVVVGSRKHNHINPVFHDLHWMSVSQNIEYKAVLTTYTVLQ